MCVRVYVCVDRLGMCRQALLMRTIEWGLGRQG